MKSLIFILFLLPITLFGFTKPDSSSFLEVKLNPTLLLSGNVSITIEKSIFKGLSIEGTYGIEKNFFQGSANPFWRFSSTVPETHFRGGWKFSFAQKKSTGFFYFYTLYKRFDFKDATHFDKGAIIYESGNGFVTEYGLMYGQKRKLNNFFFIEPYIGFGYRETSYNIFQTRADPMGPRFTGLIMDPMFAFHLGVFVNFRLKTPI